MSALIVTITDTDELAQAIDRYLRTLLKDHVDVCYMTYENSRLSGQLVRQADMFLLELFRRDAFGYRAEGLYVAERFATNNKRVLLFSGDIKAGQVESEYYWDLASLDSLFLRVERLLAAPRPVAARFGDIAGIFNEFCRPALDSHHH